MNALETSTQPGQAATAAAAATAPEGPAATTADHAIAALIAESRQLSAAQLEQVARLQQAKGLRFGEAAMALGLATREDVQRALGRHFRYPTAADAAAPRRPELVTLGEPHGVQAESFRAIRSQLTLRALAGAAPRRPLAVVSPHAGDGKTFFAANLAVSLAQLGGRTLLVDANLRGARQHEVFGMGNAKGLSDLLSGWAGADVVQGVPGVPGLSLLAGGLAPPNPLELVEGPAFGEALQALLGRFDHVLVDTPAAGFGSDSLVIAARCGSALVVARQHKARVSALRDLAMDLAQHATAIAGVVYNEY